MSPRMTFTAGSDALASQVNTYLMDQAVMTFASATARNSAISSPTEGMLTYLSDINQYQFYTGAVWQPLAGEIPWLEATKTANQSIATATETVVSYPNTVLNRGFTVSYTASPLAYTVTIITPGIYTINAGVYWAANATGYRLTRIYINNVLLANDQSAPVASANQVGRAVLTTRLVAGDVIEIRVLQNSGSSINAQIDLSRLSIVYQGV